MFSVFLTVDEQRIVEFSGGLLLLSLGSFSPLRIVCCVLRVIFAGCPPLAK